MALQPVQCRQDPAQAARGSLLSWLWPWREGPVFTATRQVASCPWSSASHCPSPLSMLPLLPFPSPCGYSASLPQDTDPASHWPKPLGTWHQRKGWVGSFSWYFLLRQLLMADLPHLPRLEGPGCPVPFYLSGLWFECHLLRGNSINPTFLLCHCVSRSLFYCHPELSSFSFSRLFVPTLAPPRLSPMKAGIWVCPVHTCTPRTMSGTSRC